MRLAEAAGTASGTRITPWYAHSNGWDVVIRATSIDLAERIAAFAEGAVQSGKIAYSQADRNSAFLQWGLHSGDFKEWKKCYADCSSFASLCAMAAIGNSNFLYMEGNSPWTGNMVERFRKTALFYTISDALVTNRSNYLYRGDILVNEVSHAAVVLDYGDLTCFPSGASSTSNNSAPSYIINNKDIIEIPLGTPFRIIC